MNACNAKRAKHPQLAPGRAMRANKMPVESTATLPEAVFTQSCEIVLVAHMSINSGSLMTTCDAPESNRAVVLSLIHI